METSMNGYGENAATFACTAQLAPGTPVMVAADGSVTAAAGDFCGVVLSQRGGFAAVQLNGYASLPCSTKVQTGYRQLAAAEGKVKEDAAAAVKRLVLDSDGKTVGFIL